jgi:UDP-N-acetylmuramate--alanine ligase
MPLLEGIKKIHAVGAGGIGVSAAAKWLKHRGCEVTGSDAAENEAVAELRASGIPVSIGHRAENLPAGQGILLYSDAVPSDNPERIEARKRGWKEMSYFELIGAISREVRTLAVSGTNGKSTTTAILGTMLADAGFDPTVIVGSKVASFPDSNLRLGKGSWFVVEACEHRANMLKVSPRVIVLTNVEEDHLDFYGDFEHIKAAFAEYVQKLPQDGLLISNADDSASASLPRPECRVVTYGMDKPADFRAVSLRVGDGRQSFRILKRGESLGEFEIRLPGRFNVMNALAAIAAASELGAGAEFVHRTAASFPGIWRRFERVGERGGMTVYSDYGHHPTAVAATLAAAREFHPGRRAVLCFQPHHRNRTRRLFDDFVASFDGADVLVLPEIYDVAGREADEDIGVSSRQLVEAVSARDKAAGKSREVAFAADPDAALTELRHLVRSGDVVIIMGAGDIYRIAKPLVG